MVLNLIKIVSIISVQINICHFDSKCRAIVKIFMCTFFPTISV